MRRLFLLSLFFPLSLLATSETKISAKEAYYNGNKLILEEEVELENEMGTLRALHAEINRIEKKGESILSFDSLEVRGDVHIQLHNGGELTCDSVNGISIEKTLHFQGEKGIVYRDEAAEIQAESGILFFEEKEEHRLEPSKVHLFGSVKLIKKGSQYAVADFVEYLPQLRHLNLKGEKSPVLFVDDEKGMTLSAKEVVASKDEIRGIGDVRFTFSEEELNKLMEMNLWKKKHS